MDNRRAIDYLKTWGDERPLASVCSGALVTPETEIPEGTLALGAPAKVRGPLAGTPAERWVRANPEGYQALAQRHKASIQPC